MTTTNDMPITIKVVNGQINVTLENNLPAGEYILKNQFTGTLTHAPTSTGTSNITITTPLTPIQQLQRNTIYTGELENSTDVTVTTSNGLITIENVLTTDTSYQEGDQVYFIPLTDNMENLINDNLIDDTLPIDQNISAMEGEEIRELWLIQPLRYKDNVLYIIADANPEVFMIPQGVTQITNNEMGLTLNVHVP